jgi:hypothetical protein
LGTYFELLVYDLVNQHRNLQQEESNKETVLQKMTNAEQIYKSFFPSNEYHVNWKQEQLNITN